MTRKPPTTESLIRKHRALWRVTCSNPFVIGVRDGSLPLPTFERWLEQDRHFLDGLFVASARVLALAPERDRRLMVDALRVAHEQLVWFDKLLVERGLDPAAPVQPVCRAYCDYLSSLAFEPYTVGIVAIWTQYRAYLEAWSAARPGAKKFRPLIRQWASSAFVQFERRFASAADAALAAASPRVRGKAEEAFAQVTRYELDFWVMLLRTEG